ncbi:mannosyltransferase family protein [Tengunoibacter tsumagoiensis]|uniref:Glycosyltransferase RgtA/B/C/D-like domain-containing protein n=1 Tax=Tengunoibacter tsumagoiensis TaxID=2014871 RepID=A0A402A1L4_9CHLR|nr:mannosyltransferase family protein [Tengunoibacter tsumagoiensis]GCE13014.1 hypothetical protein KTT_28730 [Tengunoibacter tsumagoiensis]
MIKKVPWGHILWLFVLTRLFLVAITYIAYILFTAPKYSSTPVDVVALFTTWNHWDAANYTRIAEYGYLPFDIAFFPLYPFLIAAFSHLLGSWSYILVGTIISNLALLGTLCFLYLLTTEHFGTEIAKRTLLYLCLFPTAFFFFAPYNESLYLFFCTGCFYALRRERWWWAGIFGFFAALTRNVGILLLLPYFYELWPRRAEVLATAKGFIHRTFPMLLIPLGTGVFALYCWRVFGSPLAFVTVQAHAGRHLAWPWVGVGRSLQSLFFLQPFGSSNQAHILLNLAATLGFIVLLIVGQRSLPRVYTLWMAVFMVYILLYPALEKPDPLLSNQRFVLEMFPAFMTLALVGKRYPRVHNSLMALFPGLLAILSIMFLLNRWMV